MKKLIAITMVIGLVASAGADVLISQYAEDGNIKGVEIWNSGDSSIAFSSGNELSIANFNNGTTSAKYTFTKDSGTIGAGEVLVFADGSVNSIWDDSSITYEEANFSFNGNDALELKLGGTLVDEFGIVGNDPDSSWTGSGVDTKDQNIQLKEGITSGDTDGWNDPSTRFETVASAPLDGSGNNLDGFGVAPIPEPTTFALFGFLGIAALLRRRLFRK